MSGLAYSVDLYRKLGGFITDLGRRHTQGRVLSVLEGGYHLETSSASALRHILPGYLKRQE
jgi:acetoin utilization deacetylase AcuC-like enzyme